MIDSKIIFAITFCIIVITDNLYASNLNLKSQTSSIKVSSGSTFLIENQITGYGGKLIQESGSTISGEKITFDNGIIEDRGNTIFLSGDFTSTSSNQIILNGDCYCYFRDGNSYQEINVSGKNNKIAGSLINSNNIELQDQNSSLSCAIINELGCNINLNGGSLYLVQNLKFADGKKFIGPGKIIFNDFRLSLGGKDLNIDKSTYFDNASDLQINSNISLDEIITFSGSNNIISGNNNTISMGSSGAIVVEAGSRLTIKNLSIENASGANIRCSDNSGKIIFHNVEIHPSSNITFSSGSFEVSGEFEICGTYTFSYQTTTSSIINSNASLILNDSTFSYAPNAALNNLLVFEDETSNIYMKNATLHITSTDLLLTKGNVVINGVSTFSCDDYGQIIIGDNNSSNDIYFKFLNNSSLKMIRGTLVYQNVSENAWEMESEDVSINIYSNATLNLQQNLDLKNGIANFYTDASLDIKSGKYILNETNMIDEYK